MRGGDCDRVCSEQALRRPPSGKGPQPLPTGEPLLSRHADPGFQRTLVYVFSFFITYCACHLILTFKQPWRAFRGGAAAAAHRLAPTLQARTPWAPAHTSICFSFFCNLVCVSSYPHIRAAVAGRALWGGTAAAAHRRAPALQTRPPWAPTHTSKCFLSFYNVARVLSKKRTHFPHSVNLLSTPLAAPGADHFFPALHSTFLSLLLVRVPEPPLYCAAAALPPSCTGAIELALLSRLVPARSTDPPMRSFAPGRSEHLRPATERVEFL